MIPKQILMPYLGTPAEEQLLGNLCRMANTNKAAVTILRVLEVPMSLAISAKDVPGADQAKQALDRAADVAARCGIKARTMLVPARDTGAAIIEQASSVGADLIVMEAMQERQRQFSDSPIARTVDLVLRRAPCAVWVSRIWEPRQT